MTHCILGETRRRSMLGALAAVFGALGSIATAVSPAAAQNGALIQTQPLYGAPDGAAAYRILYRSTGLSGEPIVVSGMVVIPQGDPPPGGRPIVAWAHPTTGVAPRCAPSLARVRFQMIQGLRDMVERGYVVTATDYPGLGTPQTHPYLVGDSEGRAVLDSVRAARALPDAQAGSRFAVWGHSQGGQAALYTGLLAKGYAPDLQLVGVAAAAPATELSTLMRDDLGTSGGNNLTAMTLWSWARVYGAPIDNVVEPRRDAGGQPASRGMHRVRFSISSSGVARRSRSSTDSSARRILPASNPGVRCSQETRPARCRRTFPSFWRRATPTSWSAPRSPPITCGGCAETAVRCAWSSCPASAMGSSGATARAPRSPGSPTASPGSPPRATVVNDETVKARPRADL